MKKYKYYIELQNGNNTTITGYLTRYATDVTHEIWADEYLCNELLSVIPITAFIKVI